jgi:hypothetical protein
MSVRSTLAILDSLNLYAGKLCKIVFVVLGGVFVVLALDAFVFVYIGLENFNERMESVCNKIEVGKKYADLSSWLKEFSVDDRKTSQNNIEIGQSDKGIIVKKFRHSTIPAFCWIKFDKEGSVVSRDFMPAVPAWSN